jgi:hypothetical protein
MIIFDEDDYRYDTYITYRNIVIYLTLLLLICAILSYYLIYLYYTGDVAHTFNLTNGSFDYMENITGYGNSLYNFSYNVTSMYSYPYNITNVTVSYMNISNQSEINDMMKNATFMLV